MAELSKVRFGLAKAYYAVIKTDGTYDTPAALPGAVSLDLSREENRTFKVSADKGVNVIEIRDGRIRVQSADCADQTCVRMGWLDSAAMPIVCLPHGLVIAYTDADSEVDALAQ